MQEFEKIHGRPCENSDKEQIKHLYTKYIDTNKKHEALQKKFEVMKQECMVKKISLDERHFTPMKMRSRSPSSNLNISVDSVLGNPSREREKKTPREEAQYRDKAESLEKENAQLRKEIRSKVSVGRNPNQTPTSVANNIICSASSMELQQLKAERDHLKQELIKIQQIMRESKKELFDPVLIEAQQQLEHWKNKANDMEKNLQGAQKLIEKYKQDYENVLNQITENQENDNPELSTLKSQLAYCASELMIYRDKLLPTDSSLDIDFMYQKKKLLDENINLHNEINSLNEKIQSISQENSNKLKEIEAKNVSSIKQIHEELQKSRKENIRLLELEKEYKSLKEKFKEEKKIFIENNFSFENKVSGLIKEIQDLKMIQSNKDQELKDSVRQRKLLHNQLEDLRGKIRVFCRVRPMTDEEKKSGQTNIVTICDEFSVNIEAKPGLIKNYVYDTVFGPNASQEEVFEDSRRLMQSAVDGFNVCIFAYGQTGSGKTHTIQGYPDCPGIAPRGIEELYNIIEMMPQSYINVITCYMIEIHLDTLKDLLRPNTRDPAPSLSIKTDLKGMVYIPEVFIMNANSASEMRGIYEEGIKHRHVSATKQNQVSSRSHLIFSILIESCNQETGVRTVGKICFVDLAGSERLKKSEATKEALRETNCINKSLSALGDVISALLNKLSHIPYRNNKLTMLMSDSIGGTAKTLMFVNISPVSANREETLTSLMFGSKAKLITNEPIKNIESKELSRLRTEIAQVANQRDKFREALVNSGIIQQKDDDSYNEE